MFNIDIETCQACGGAIKVISLIIEKILAYPDKEVASVETGLLPEVGAPPQAGLFD